MLPVIFFFIVVAIPNQITRYPAATFFPLPFGWSLSSPSTFSNNSQSIPFQPSPILLFSPNSSETRNFMEQVVFGNNSLNLPTDQISLVGVDSLEDVYYFFGNDVC